MPLKRKAPSLVKRGSVTVNIYHGADGACSIAWYEGGQRVIKRRKSFDEAKRLAEEVAIGLHNGRAQGEQLTGEDRAIYLDLRSKLDAFHLTLTEAVDVVIRANKMLEGEATILEAIRFYKAHGGSKIVEKTVGEAYGDYRSYKEAKGLSKRTLESIILHVGRFAGEFHDRPMTDLSHQEIEAFLSRAYQGNRYFNNARAEIATFFSWCRQEHFLPDVDTEAHKVGKRREIEEAVTIFSPQEFEAILEAVRVDLIPYLALSAFGGLRPSEAQRVDWKCIDWQRQEGHIEIKATVARKTYRNRFVPLNDALRAFLEPFRKEEGLVCHWKLPQTLLIEDYKKIREKSPKLPRKWPADVLRHSFGSYRLKQTEDRARTAEEMGNSPDIIKRHYRRPITGEQARLWFAIRPPSDFGDRVAAWKRSIAEPKRLPPNFRRKG